MTTENEKRRYRKIKLLPEIITVIKKALISYDTKELATEKVTALSLLSHDDYFLCLYIGDRRKHVKKSETTV